MTKTIGYVLIGVAGLILVIGGLWLAAGLATGSMQVGGAVLGFGLLAVLLVAPLGGAGIFVLAKGRTEAQQQASSDAMRKVLDMVQARGQVAISDVVIELGSTQQQVQDILYKLVGMGLFSGYINWNQGTLYTSEAAALHDLEQCKNCGGQIKLAGKGVLRCPFCGTEYFLAK